MLPAEFKCLEDLLQDMPIMTKKSTPGLLATGRLGGLIDNGDFPDLSEQVKQVVDCRLLHGMSCLHSTCHSIISRLFVSSKCLPFGTMSLAPHERSELMLIWNGKKYPSKIDCTSLFHVG